VLDFFTNKKLKPDFVDRAVNYLGSYKPSANDTVSKAGQSHVLSYLWTGFCATRLVIFGFGYGLAFVSTIIIQINTVIQLEI